jgi:hypothetical protein
MRPVAPPPADGEWIALRTEASDEGINHFHGYEPIHRVPWLYERIVQDFLRRYSPQTEPMASRTH